jgi:uncharacterized protein (DUF2062 family)
VIATDWSSVEPAGAFLVGAILGVIATLRLTRTVSTFWRREREQQNHDPNHDQT